jgi:serine/threonine protein kinase
LLTGVPPFIGKNDKETYQKILKGDVPYPEDKWDNISANVKNLVENMLQVDPEKRISAK